MTVSYISIPELTDDLRARPQFWGWLEAMAKARAEGSHLTFTDLEYLREIYAFLQKVEPLLLALAFAGEWLDNPDASGEIDCCVSLTWDQVRAARELLDLSRENVEEAFRRFEEDIDRQDREAAEKAPP